MELIIGFGILILLLFISAMISGSEIAYFSLNNSDKQFISEIKTRRSKLVLDLLKRPDSLLATILVSNNFINVLV